MKFFVIICMCFILNSCFDKDSKKDKIKLNKVEDASQIADFELEFENEKIALISIIQGISTDSVKLVLRDYFTKNYLSNDIENEFTEKIIDTISEHRKMSKQKIASIIFSFKYEMQTKTEIEENAIDTYEDFLINKRESQEEQY